MYWNETLTYVITPKSGPVRQLRTLLDARSALVEDLPAGGTKRPHWLQAGLRVVAASESGLQDDISAATDALLAALEKEGWMNRPSLR
ncbi:MAG: hypothetical protein ACRECO_12950 [Xanthobacteraceae bacterium]